MVRDTTQSDDTDQSGDGVLAAFDTIGRSRREILTKATAGSVALALGVTGATGSAAGLQDDENGEETETPETETETETPDDDDDQEEEDEDEDEAEVEFRNQESDGQSVTVESVTLPNGGYVVLHDAGLFEGDALDSTIGASEFLDEGEQEDVEVQLSDDAELSETAPLVAMPHEDSDGDEEFGFVESEGEADGPYTNAGQPVVDLAFVVVE